MHFTVLVNNADDQEAVRQRLASFQHEVELVSAGWSFSDLTGSTDAVLAQWAMVFGGADRLLQEPRRADLPIVVLEGNAHPVRDAVDFRQRTLEVQRQGAAGMLELPFSQRRAGQLAAHLSAGLRGVALQKAMSRDLEDECQALDERRSRPVSVDVRVQACFRAAEGPPGWLKRRWLKTQINKAFPYDLVHWVYEDSALWDAGAQRAVPAVTALDEKGTVTVEVVWALTGALDDGVRQEIVAATERGLVGHDGVLDLPAALAKGLDLLPTGRVRLLEERMRDA